MAWAIVPEPGSEYLCKEPCKHTDCADIRKTAAAECPHCHDPIGFGAKWNIGDGNRPQHAVCGWKAAD